MLDSHSQEPGFFELLNLGAFIKLNLQLVKTKYCLNLTRLETNKSCHTSVEGSVDKTVPWLSLATLAHGRVIYC